MSQKQEETNKDEKKQTNLQNYLKEYKREFDEKETSMADIHNMAMVDAATFTVLSSAQS